MRIAMPISGNRAPGSFDIAQASLLMELGDGREIRRTETALVAEPLIQRAARLMNLKVKVLMFEAILPVLAQAARKAGMVLKTPRKGSDYGIENVGLLWFRHT